MKERPSMALDNEHQRSTLEASQRRAGISPLATAATLVLLLGPAPALAQADPKFTYGKAEEVKEVEWKAQAKGGFVLTTGNSQTSAGSFGIAASRKKNDNKLSLDASLAYARSGVLGATDGDMSGFIE